MRTALPLPLAFFLAFAAFHAPRPAHATRKQAPKLEVAFVLDATGSMGPYIQQAREQIKVIARELASGEPAPEVKFALVTYRDKGDEYVTNVNPFSADVEIMKALLDATEANGGGDNPEAALEGLDDAIRKLKWSSTGDVVRIIYLIGDAPAKHYDGGPTEDSVTKAAREKNIVIHSIACGHLGEDGRETWSKVARLTEGRTYNLGTASYASKASGLGDAAATGGLERASLAATIGGSARAYSSSVGVDYSAGTIVSASHLAEADAVATTGLVGAHVRWIRDPIAWRDAWAAHVSTLPRDSQPALPALDFTTHAVIIAGGSGAGLAIDEVRVSGTARAVTARPLDGEGAAFAVIPVSPAGGAK